MKNYLLLFAAGALLASCGVDNVPQPSVTENYQRDFIKTFGVIAQNQTWRMVEQQYVVVDVEEPSNVKAYVNVGGKYYIVADYKDVQGQQKLTFDVPTDAQDVQVYVNGIPYNVDSRAFIADSDADNNGIITKKDEYVYYTLGQIKNNIENKNDAQSVLPEGADNRGVDGLKMDFTAIVDDANDKGDGVEDGYATYTIYPIFWNAMYDHTFGLYYFDGNKMVEIDFYENKTGDCMQYYGPGSQYFSSFRWRDITTDYSYEWYEKYESTINSRLDDTDQVLRGRAFTFRLPVGRTFGFYVNVSHQSGSQTVTRKYYSNPTLNSNARQAFSYYEVDSEITTSTEVDEETGNVTTKTETKTNTYICVEDIPIPQGHISDGEDGYGDMDYNDFIFLLEGTQAHVGESGPDTSTPVEYLYAVEDLGGTFDYDFNDVVFEVSHVSGLDHLHIVPVAAGGQLPAYICYDNSDGVSFKSDEFHSYFGVESNTMVNTYKFELQPLKGFAVPVSSDWSHTQNSTADNGLTVLIERKDGTMHTVNAPEKGSAPQMLILPMDWKFPTELTRINTAYPDFGEWGAGYIQGTGWLNNCVESVVIDYSVALVQPSTIEEAEDVQE